MNRPFLVGICGGSASGKTSIAHHLKQALPEHRAVIISTDSYYLDLCNFPKHISGNYDHPDSLDMPLLISQLHQLKAGKAIRVPCYDFKTHTRKSFYDLEPTPIIIVEGLLLFSVEQLITLLDLKIFIDTSMDLMLLRRLRRDIVERGRSVDSVMEQYMDTVRPMYFEFVLKNRHRADIILPGDGSPDDCFSHLKQSLNSMSVCELADLA